MQSNFDDEFLKRMLAPIPETVTDSKVKKPNPFDMVNKILYKKVNERQLDEIEIENIYDRFLCKKALAFYPDMYEYCAIINTMDLSPVMEFDFLYSVALPNSKKRKWAWKKQAAKSKHIDNIMEYYDISENKAKECINSLTDDELNEIEKLLCQGGVIKGKK